MVSVVSKDTGLCPSAQEADMFLAGRSEAFAKQTQRLSCL